MPEAVTCNLCGSDVAKPLFRLRDYRLWVDDAEWSAVRCRSCGLGYLNPRPTEEEMRRYYPAAYFGDRQLHMERYRREAAYVPGTGGRLLDIGAGSGGFLSVMRDRGWDVTGIEPADEAGNPHGVRMSRSLFPEDCELPPASFDVITAWAVFEHLRDPGQAFSVTERLLRPGGSLILQVPNLRSIYSRWALQEDVPRHLYFFTEMTLRAYGRRVGLDLERVFHTTDLFGGSGRGVMRLMLLRALGRSTREFFEVWSTPRWDRFRRWPLLAVAWTATSAIERLLLADRVVRACRMSGQIVAEFRKPAASKDRSGEQGGG